MARIQGIAGGLSGKMGNAVFRQRNGETIISQYQPVVVNPNTVAQQVARAKFKLITQLAAIMAPTLGIINSTARQGRNPRTGFVAKNYPLIVAVPSSESAERVTIPMEQLQLTESLDYFGTIQAERDVTDQNKITVSINIPEMAGGRKKAKIALVSFGTMGVVNRPARARVIQVVDVPFVDNSLNYTFDGNRDEKYTVLAYGMYERGAGDVSLDYDNIHTPDDAGFISAVNIEKAVSEGSMQLTETIGVNVETF